MNLQELIARAIVAAEGEGHNDPPLFDDYDEITQGSYLDMAQFVLDVLNKNGHKIVPLKS